MRLGRRSAGLIGIATALSLAACTGGPSTAPTPTAPYSPTSVAVPTAIPNDPALRAEVEVTSCDATNGGWAAGGRITNGSADDREYRITVLFTTAQATVIGVGATTARVAAGHELEWSVSAELLPASPTLCVLSGVG